MSKKYVPSFLKGANTNDATATPLKEEPPARAFLQKERINSAGFTRASSLPSDIHKKELKSTTLMPATLASITSHSSNGAKSSTSFASKFAEQVRNSEDPNYQKPVDISSVDDFPALGGPRQKNSVVVPPLQLRSAATTVDPQACLNPPLNPRLSELKINVNKGASPTFAEMASLWAKKKEEDDREKAEAERRKELEEEKMRQAARLMKKVPVLGSIGRRRIGEEGEGGEEEENAYVNPDEQSSLGGGSNYEYEEEEESFGEDDDDEGGNDDEQDEHNPNVEWNRRHQDDLY